MTLLLFLTGLTTIASTGGGTSSNAGALFAVSGGQPTADLQVTQVSYTPAPMSARTE